MFADEQRRRSDGTYLSPTSSRPKQACSLLISLPSPPPPCQLPCDLSTSPHDTKAMWTSAEPSPRGALIRVITLSCKSRKAGEFCATGRRLVSISGRATAQRSHLHRNCPVPSASVSSVNGQVSRLHRARSPIEISSHSSVVLMPPFFWRSI